RLFGVVAAARDRRNLGDESNWSRRGDCGNLRDCGKALSTFRFYAVCVRRAGGQHHLWFKRTDWIDNIWRCTRSVISIIHLNLRIPPEQSFHAMLDRTRSPKPAPTVANFAQTRPAKMAVSSTI